MEKKKEVDMEKKMESITLNQKRYRGVHDANIYIQWRSQEFRLGGARLKNKIGNKKLININNKISKQLYDNLIVIQNLT